MKIDVHVHLYPASVAGHIRQALLSWGIDFAFDMSANGYLKQMEQVQITKALVNNHVLRADLISKANDFIAAQVEANADRLIGMAFVHPLASGAAKELERCVKGLGFKAVKVSPSFLHSFPNDRRMYPFYEKVIELNIPILSHCGQNTEEMYTRLPSGEPEYSEPRHWRPVLEDFPQLRLVLAHVAGAATFWDDAVSLMHDFPNVAADTSLFPRLMPAERLMEFIKTVGPDRVMYGSDFPGADAVDDTRRLLSLPFNDSDREMILWQNASRFFSLG